MSDHQVVINAEGSLKTGNHSKFLNDMVFLCLPSHGVKVPAPRQVLLATSNYFKDVLQPGMLSLFFIPVKMIIKMNGRLYFESSSSCPFTITNFSDITLLQIPKCTPRVLQVAVAYFIDRFGRATSYPAELSSSSITNISFASLSNVERFVFDLPLDLRIELLSLASTFQVLPLIQLLQLAFDESIQDKTVKEIIDTFQ